MRSTPSTRDTRRTPDEPQADSFASAPAAVATAARDVLLAENPTQAAAIESAYAMSLAAIPPGPAKDAGLAIGHAAAAAIQNQRSSDGSSTADIPYTPGTAPGEWRPTPNPFPANPPPPSPGFARATLPGWGNVVPFTLNDGAQFRPDGPPELTSDVYAQDYNEVQDIGEQQSVVRTLEQSEIARFWYQGFGPGWNRIARIMAQQRTLDMWDTARLLALVNVAMADGFIAGWNTRYVFNFWRPVTAIREGDTDGNPNTVADANWNSYLNTPAIPDYPSTHSVLGGAASEVLERFFGADDIAFTTTSGAPFAGITRSFTSFSQAAEENASSRVYAGIHFRTACNDGIKLGRKIGKFAFKHFLEPPS